MRSAEEIKEYLRENLRYELLMLRYTLAKINTLLVITEQDQMNWNAYFESFAIHARNIHSFLTNDDNNVMAQDFIPEFKAKKTNDTKSTFGKLNPQVLHLGWKRPINPLDKANVDDAKLLSQWIEREFKRFRDRLGEPYRSAWNEHDADPSTVTFSSRTVVLGATGPAASSATNAPTTVVFGATGSAAPTTTNAPTSATTIKPR